jgi:hypothetical protein
MPDWLYHLPVVWMAVVITAGTFVVAALAFAIAAALAARGHGASLKAISPVMLTPLAVIFGLIVAFLASQVWSDVTRASAAVAREANALRAIVVLAHHFPGEIEKSVRALVRRHIDDAAKQEWPAMARHTATLAMVTGEGTDLLELMLSAHPQNEAQGLAQREILAVLRTADDARRERIVISQSSINWVKWGVVYLLATLILLTIAFIHVDNRFTATVALTLFSVGVAACVVLIASHNRPFTGEISVGPDLLLQVMPPQ